MLLERLREYSHRLQGIAPPGYQKTAIRWLIDLTPDGKLVGFVPTTAGEGGKRDRGRRYQTPHILRTSAIKAKLLADRADYALGLAEPGTTPSKRQRVAECHQAFVSLVADCARETGEATALAVQRFLAGVKLEALPLPQDMKPSDVVTFRIGDILPIHLPSVQVFWERSQASGGTLGQCLVCGRERPILERHPLMIKGIPGGQPSGTAIVSANAPAFESYGLSASLIAPVCQDCAERYAKAANTLIASEGGRLYLGSAVYLFWTRQPSSFNPTSLLSDPRPEDVKALLESAFRGREAPAIGGGCLLCHRPLR